MAWIPRHSDQTLFHLRSNPVSSETIATTLFRRLLVREPEASEVADLVAYFDSQRRRFAASELDAAKIAAKPGASPDLAAWTMVARAILNLDEAVTKG